jgi:hypothetical protein
MELKIIYGLVVVLLALGLFQLYQSSKVKENLNHKPVMPLKNSHESRDGGIVYNINEREIVINEVIDNHTGEPKPSSSLKCNCWPLENKGDNPASMGKKHKNAHHKHTMHPHKEEHDSTHHIPTHKGYTKQIHSRDPQTGLIEEKGPKGAEPYQLVSSFQ